MREECDKCGAVATHAYTYLFDPDRLGDEDDVAAWGVSPMCEACYREQIAEDGCDPEDMEDSVTEGRKEHQRNWGG